MRKENEFYGAMVIEHAKHPRHYGHLDEATISLVGSNVLCGDSITIELIIAHDRIEEFAFTAEGCAISIASASMLGDIIHTAQISTVKDKIHKFQEFVSTRGSSGISEEEFKALAHVGSYPGRSKCVLLAWETLLSLDNLWS